MPTLIFILILFVFVWVFLVLPSRRRQKSHQGMQDSVGVGDVIITAGGIHGTVQETGDTDVQLEIAPGIVVTLDRRAIAAVADDVEDEEAEDEDEDEDEEGLADDEPVDDGEVDEAQDPDQAEESLRG
jgi:preprotein translocase subunit YajC